MENGLCYILYNSSTIYAFPELHCSEGSILPSFSSTTRQTYYLHDGKPYLSNSTTITNSGYNNYSSYVAHIATGDRYEFVGLGSFLLPAVLIMLCFFAVIYRWFIRLRG